MSTTQPGPYEVYRIVGVRIRVARLARKMSQQELADAVEYTRTSIVNIEGGRQRVQLQTVYDLADALGVPPKSLLPD